MIESDAKITRPCSIFEPFFDLLTPREQEVLALVTGGLLKQADCGGDRPRRDYGEDTPRAPYEENGGEIAG